ncbi:MAG: zinc-binding dehydrogenase [Streptococcaceae bacterium]|jgi:NADPH:quinone reductase-like Zn-dependent oxidoreductase|nr:zinc-binding dehydrogenase [Streptococcaceae bacterium]
MKAFVIANPRDRRIEQIQKLEVAEPLIAPDDVLVTLKACGLNPVDYKLVESGVSDWTYPHVLGVDGAGLVSQVGNEVTAFQVGDRVFCHDNLHQNGAFAEKIVIKAAAVAHMPDGLSFEDAAAMLCGAMTAYQALYRKANLAMVNTVLIHAGAGGVGMVAIQLAKHLNLRVITTVSTQKKAFAEALGADVVIDYRTEDVTARLLSETAGLGVDLSINTIGGTEVQADIGRMAFNGQIVVIGDTLPEQLDLSSKALSIAKIALGGAHTSNNPAQVQDLARMAEALGDLVQSGQLKPMIERVLAFDEIPAGLAALKVGQVSGKLVARID